MWCHLLTLRLLVCAVFLDIRHAGGAYTDAKALKFYGKFHPFKVLELPLSKELPAADVLKKAFKKGALKWHPDRCGRKGKPDKPANTPLTGRRGGIGRLSRTAVYKKKELYKRKKQVAAKKVAEKALLEKKTIGGAGNGGFRMVATTKASRYYPTEDAKVPVGNHKTAGTAKLRSSMTPGTVLILLSGKFRGKRVVFLKQLASGLLLVTGPYAVNGVPLKRVDQVYAIATSTKVDISGIALPAEVDDTFFSSAGGKKSGDFFEKAEEEKKAVDPARVAIQKSVDAGITKAIDGTPMLKDYMKALFTLRKGQYPHEMVF